jgi:enediyne biosynthesis protein E4
MGMSVGVARRWRALLLVAVAGGLLYGSWRLFAFWSYRASLAEIRAEVQAGRHNIAAKKLTALLAREPRSDEAAYLLGLCERSRGQPEAASRAWARVPPESSFAASAVRSRAEVLVDQGRLADAEQLLQQALDDPRIDPDLLRKYQAPLYSLEGRLEEARRLVEESWERLNQTGRGGWGDAIELIKRHILLSVPTAPAEATRTLLERAERLAPDDDRVWLARANLAIHQGALDEAERGLDACLRRRPDDIPVWRARLDWALATGRVAEVHEALAHLPVVESSPAQIPRLAAWLAARRGDAESERRALERFIAVEPADDALDRLAELAVRADQPARAAELRRQKAELEQVRDRFQQLLGRNQPLRHAAELARLAVRLGRTFEARGFWSVALVNDPANADFQSALARLRTHEAPDASPGRTLAEVLAPELKATEALPRESHAPRKPVPPEKPGL